ncbi:hypothetical protein AB5N19_01223 [Seiridium cardinale]|uniref:Uncharacterized protein n=1 Tax=Seiridium cardinale TaxID=138064 RepID=A0ABR2XYQ8_9PEZI
MTACVVHGEHTVKDLVLGQTLRHACWLYTSSAAGGENGSVRVPLPLTFLIAIERGLSLLTNNVKATYPPDGEDVVLSRARALPDQV